MTVTERITALRKQMKEKGIDAYLVPTDDFHGSEYVGDYFKCRKYITGFTGSAGTAVIMQDMAGLWTDGRYFIQAAQQLEGTPVTLFKMGEPDVPTIHKFLEENLKWLKEGTINFLIGQDAAVQGHSPVIILFQLLFDSKAPEKEYQYSFFIPTHSRPMVLRYNR